MNVTVLLSIALWSVLVLGANSKTQEPMLKDTIQSRYKVGQVWKYKTRSHEETSTLTILKVENHQELGNIVHIILSGLRIKNPHNDKGITETILHMPFAEEALNKSVVRLLKEKTELLGNEEGYREWRQAFDAGQAGIYTITVAEAVKVAEKTLNQ